MSKTFDNILKSTLGGGIPLMIFIIALLAGAMALQFTPREEEPQIVVPMVDVLVQAAGLSATQVERQVTTPLEKLLSQIIPIALTAASVSNSLQNSNLKDLPLLYMLPRMRPSLIMNEEIERISDDFIIIIHINRQ